MSVIDGALRAVTFVMFVMFVALWALLVGMGAVYVVRGVAHAV